MRAVAFLLLSLFALGGCDLFRSEGPRDEAIDVAITRDVRLTLPPRPAFPEVRQLSQMVTARFAERQDVFQAQVLLAPDQVRLALAPPGAPTMVSVIWQDGRIDAVRQEDLMPGLRVAELLGVLYLVYWPAGDVRSRLADGLELRESESGRTLRAGDRTLITITRSGSVGTRRIEIDNRDLGYRLEILSREGG